VLFRSYEVKKRSLNLEVTYKQFPALLEVADALHILTQSADSRMERLHQFMHSSRGAIYKNWKLVSDNSDFIREQIQSSVSYLEWFAYNTTGSRDLQTKSGTLFSAQVGIAGFQVVKHIEGVKVLPKLTAGVNFNFRQIDKSLDRRTIRNRGFAHNFSGYLGVTFGKFQDDEFDNFLPSNSLLLGLNWRIIDVLYFSLGGSVHKQRYRNPLINSHHSQFGAYAAVLLDLDFAKAATSITSILFK